MPIRPENQHHYRGKGWRMVRADILDRANNDCEGSPAYPHCRVSNGTIHPVTGGKVVLTIAHLDHNPANNDPANLRAWCQRCHNTYDAKHRAAGIKARKEAKNARPPSQWEDGKQAIARALAEIRTAEQHFRDGGHLTSLYLCCRLRNIAKKIQEAIANA